jgi:hypothetical protein
LDTVSSALTQESPASSAPPANAGRANAAPAPSAARSRQRGAAFEWPSRAAAPVPSRAQDARRSPSPGNESGYTGRTEADVAGDRPGPARMASRASARQTLGRDAQPEREQRRTRTQPSQPADPREMSPEPPLQADRQAQAAREHGMRVASPS